MPLEEPGCEERSGERGEERGEKRIEERSDDWKGVSYVGRQYYALAVDSLQPSLRLTFILRKEIIHDGIGACMGRNGKHLLLGILDELCETVCLLLALILEKLEHGRVGCISSAGEDQRARSEGQGAKRRAEGF